MIDSISDMSLYQSIQSTNTSSKASSLSSSQLETIESVLSNYDASSLTEEQASEIVAAFEDANIEPSKELAQAMSSFGFDAKEVGDLAGVSGPQGGMPPPPPPPSQSDQDSISSVLDMLLNGEDEDSSTSTSLDTILDYTSRILSLNDSAQSEVQELLETYSPENTELSSEDAKTIVQNALSQILNDEDNYNSTSFYG